MKDTVHMKSLRNLHVLICKNLSKDKKLLEAVDIGGIINFIVPELNDFYSGWETKQPWRLNCHNIIRNDKDVYIALIKRFKENCHKYSFYTEDCLYSSFNEFFGLWSRDKNKKLFEEIRVNLRTTRYNG